ncbi:acyl carrier protein [Aquabacterium sp. OR-4]|uniref:acyl carrier protein n=1 Tax=Aquabacterium sp. OR-4 TaxID=2978127 RepID=UPI0021B43BF4|nr:acyl carrier protein [Aquabacterium sp. OR-4]MDT7836750.1 acyl carrier protein [Aquabacterium sp. OR-4]
MSSLPALQALIEKKYGLGPADIDPNISMREKGLDSLALVEFLFEIEDHFGISMPDPDPQAGLQLETLAQLSEVVDRLLADKAAGAAASPPSQAAAAGSKIDSDSSVAPAP